MLVQSLATPPDHLDICAEITLNTSKEETAVCNLGSINLGRHIRDKKLDVEHIKQTVQTAMRMLDNVIDINFYPIEEGKNSNLKHRPVGLGIMGFQDALYLQDMAFDSDEAVEFADTSMETISYYAILASTKLAEERGAYATYKGSKWDRGILPLDTLDLLEQERGISMDVSRSSTLDWDVVRKAIKENGMRNSNCFACAPTATIANIAGAFPTIEPIFKNLYVKSNMSGEFTVVNHYLVEDLKKLGLWDMDLIDEIKQHDGSISAIERIPYAVREKYKEAFDIDPTWFIRLAAHRGKWIDQSQSLNLFIKGTSGKKISEVYMMAWEYGLKTTYYLRTMGATGVEKSTLNIMKQIQKQKQTITQNVEEKTYVRPKVEIEEVKKVEVSDELLVVEQPELKIRSVGAQAANDLEPQGMVQENIEQKDFELKPKNTPSACSILDPECEACQ